MGTRYSTAARVIAGLCATVICVVGMLVPAASAQPALDVEAGYEGFAHDNTSLPVRVAVQADRLISGRIEVVTTVPFGPGMDSGSVVSAPVELAGGTTKEFVLPMPPSSRSDGFRSSVTVTLYDGNTPVASQENVRIVSASGETLVGVVGELDDELPDTVDLIADLGSARLSTIPLAWLEQLSLIDGADVVAVSPTDYQSLSDVARDNLLTWAYGGGALILAGDGAIAIAAELDAAPIVDGARSTFGLGSVTAVDSGTGDSWLDAIRPGQYRPNNGGFGREVTGEGFFGGEPLTSSLSQDAGFRLPSLPAMLLLLVAYVVIGGPLAWLLLRRSGRTTAMWLVLPAIALVFTGAVWIAGSALRSGTDAAHGTILESTPVGTHATTAHLLTSRTGGVERIELPAGWQITGSQENPFMFGPSQSGTSAQGTNVLSSPTIEANIDAGGFAIGWGSGPAPQFDDALTVQSSSASDGAVAGTVTNNLDVRVDEVGVFADQAGINIGSIEPGATVDFVLNDGARDPFRGEPVDFAVWNDALRGMEFGPFGPIESEPSVVNYSLFSEYVARHKGSIRPPGQVIAAGFTDQLAAPADESITAGRTLVVARTRTVPAGDAVTNMTVQRELLRDPEQLGGGFGFGDEPEFEFVWRFNLPSGMPTDDLVIDLPANARAAAVWTGEWLSFDIGDGGDSVQLPQAAIDGADVYLRITLDGREGPFMKPRTFGVRSPGGADSVAEFVAIDDDESGEA